MIMDPKGSTNLSLKGMYKMGKNMKALKGRSVVHEDDEHDVTTLNARECWMRMNMKR